MSIRSIFKRSVIAGSLGLVAAATLINTAYAQQWQPTKPVEFIVPAGTGGGADQMARFLEQVHELLARGELDFVSQGLLLLCSIRRRPMP